MDKLEYISKYSELLESANEKEAKLEAYVQKWLNGEINKSLDNMEQIIVQVNDQIRQMKDEAKKYMLEFEKISKEEKLQHEQLESSKSAEMRLKNQLGVDTSRITITGGILSSKASESHLTGREKTDEEIKLEKQIALSTLREKVVSKEITLAQASQLCKDINNYYEVNSGRHM